MDTNEVSMDNPIPLDKGDIEALAIITGDIMYSDSSTTSNRISYAYLIFPIQKKISLGLQSKHNK